MLEEMENIKYGNLETAMYYCERNKIGKWINRSLSGTETLNFMEVSRKWIVYFVRY